MPTWNSNVRSNGVITMNGSWGAMGNYNMTINYLNASDYGTTSDFATLRLEVRPDATENNVKVVGDVAVTTSTLSKAVFTFNAANFITPASLQPLLFRVRFLDASGNLVRTANLVNSTVKGLCGVELATMVYVKANECISSITFKKSHSTYHEFDKPLTLTWNAVEQTGSFPPHHYKIWIRFSFDDGNTWNTDNNYIAPSWGVEGTTWTFNLADLVLDTKNIDESSRFRIRFGFGVVDIGNGNEVTRSEIKWAVMSGYVVNTKTGNLILASGGVGKPVGQGSIKRIIKPTYNGTRFMTLDDGSEWERIFWHDVSTDETYFTNSDEAGHCDLSNRFSRLYELRYSFDNNGVYEFLLRYPKHSTTQYNRWIQTANPYYTTSNNTQTAATMGYRAIHIDFPNNWGCGLGLSSSDRTFMDTHAGTNYWYGSLGQTIAYSESGTGNGFPTPYGTGMSQVQKEAELWVRANHSVKVVTNNPNIIHISTVQELKNLRNAINSASDPTIYKYKTIKIEADLDLSAETEYFTPIESFYGILDGQGHIITMPIGQKQSSGVTGVFSLIHNNYGTIKYLIFDGERMIFNVAPDSDVGTIANYNYGTILNCRIERDVYCTETAYVSIGTVCGCNKENGIIARCISHRCNIVGSNCKIGGIAGSNYGVVESCRVQDGYYEGFDVGGVVGYTYEGMSIINCCGYSYIKGCTQYYDFGDGTGATYGGSAGGIIGTFTGGTVNNCYCMDSLSELGLESQATEVTSGGIIGFLANRSGVYAENNYFDSAWNTAIGNNGGESLAGCTSMSASTMIDGSTLAPLLGNAYVGFWNENHFPTGNEASTFYMKNSDVYGQDGSRYYRNPLFVWEKTSSLQRSGIIFFWYPTSTSFKTAMITGYHETYGKPIRIDATWGVGGSPILQTNTPSYYNEVTGYDDSWYGAHIYISVYYEKGVISTDGYFYPDTSGGVACFLEGTPVLTSNGLKSIEDVQVGDSVLSLNEETNTIEENIVYHTYSHTPKYAFELELSNGENLIVTWSHSVYVKGKGETLVTKLQVGDILIDKNNNEITIERINNRKEIDKPVYEIWVENNRNYFAGNSSILVYSEREVIE